MMMYTEIFELIDEKIQLLLIKKDNYHHVGLIDRELDRLVDTQIFYNSRVV